MSKKVSFCPPAMRKKHEANKKILILSCLCKFQEFVPHGRTVLARHPSQIYSKGHNASASEHSLLYKLTNFAIKDESLLEAKEEEQEWWCIREVYYRADSENFLTVYITFFIFTLYS